MRFLLAVVGFTFLLSAPALAAVRPDLTVRSVRVTSGEPESGQPMTIEYKVANLGHATARATQVNFYLAFDVTRGGNDLLLGTRTVQSIKRTRMRSGRAIVKVPAAAGLFRLIVCLDDEHIVRESNEANNCRATSTDLRVGAPAGS